MFNQKKITLSNKLLIFTFFFVINLIIYDYQHFVHYSMYAESATNYVFHLNKNFPEYLVTKDFGYYSFVPRFLSYLIKIFNINYRDIPLFYLLTTRFLIFLSLSYSLKFRFDQIFNYKILNVELLSSILILFSLNYEMKFLHNVSYVGYYVMILIFINIYKEKSLNIIDYLIVLLFILSKPQILFITPFCLLLLYKFIKYRKPWMVLFFIVIIFLLFVQLNSIISYQRIFNNKSLQQANIFFILFETFCYALIHTFNYAFFSIPLLILKLRIKFALPLFIAFTIIAIYLTRYLFKKLKFNSKDLEVLFFLFTGIVFTIFTNIKQLPLAYSINIDEFGRPFQRHEFPILVNSFFIFNIFYGLINLKLISKIYFYLLLFIWPIFTYLYYIKNENKPNFIGMSNWRYVAVDNYSSAILDPVGWFYNYSIISKNYNSNDNLMNFAFSQDIIEVEYSNKEQFLIIYSKNSLKLNEVFCNNFFVKKISSYKNSYGFFTNIIEIHHSQYKIFKGKIKFLSRVSTNNSNKIIYFLLKK